MFVIPNEILFFLNHLTLSKGPIVIGVSGGADSLYLTYILHLWTKQKKINLLAVTVDHNLRQNSRQEADWVHQQLAKQGIQHTILSWNGPKPKTHIEERAREERYRLLIDFCHKNKAKFLFLAHHQQDQAETFWARLARGSGLDGLCGMAALAKRTNITIVRPLLNTPKTLIIKALKQNHVKWAEDPMNQDTNYERVRWRQTQSQLDKMGLTSDYITKSTYRLQRAKEALDFYTQAFIEQHLQTSSDGFVSLDEKTLASLPYEMRIRILLYIFNLFNRKNKIISLESIEKIALSLPKHATLNGCQWVISHNKIFVAPELKLFTPTIIPANTWVLWGNSYVFTNKTFQAKASAPKPRLKNIPFLIQRTFLQVPSDYQIIRIDTEKELEKKAKKDYKDKTPFVIIRFNKRKD